jgi:acyl-CoA thioester hydrolase
VTGAGPLPRAAPFAGGAYSIPHPRPFLCDLRIGSAHVSRAVEHVSNVEYVRWLDRAAELHADSLGWTRSALLARGLMWFVARHEIDYLAEARPGDELVLATWVRSMERVKSWRDTLVARPADGAVVCRASTLWVLVDLATRRPTRIDAEMARAFEPLHARHGREGHGPRREGARPCTSR